MDLARSRYLGAYEGLNYRSGRCPEPAGCTELVRTYVRTFPARSRIIRLSTLLPDRRRVFPGLHLA